ncbi:MAG: sulfotransferase [Bacteroidota bacterium]|nr:sulfotransferase [Bacteroidota bacterium]
MNKFIDFVKNADKRQWYWLWEMGLSKRKANIYKLRENNFADIERPVFFLSTGRTGTKWFAELLKKDENLTVFHAGVPDLAIQNKFIYDLPHSSSKIEIEKEMFLVAREEYFTYAYKTNKQFVETNNQLVFFAEAISKLLPNSVFVHLYRHPGEFVRSGMRRNWYEENDFTKFKLIANKDSSIWNNYSKLEKISWLWAETNQFIEDFKTTIDKKRVFDFNFNELNTDNVQELISFIGANISVNKISKRLNRKENIQQKGQFNSYNNWTKEERKQLKNICIKLADKYGYQL